MLRLEAERVGVGGTGGCGVHARTGTSPGSREVRVDVFRPGEEERGCCGHGREGSLVTVVERLGEDLRFAVVRVD